MHRNDKQAVMPTMVEIAQHIREYCNKRAAQDAVAASRGASAHQLKSTHTHWQALAKNIMRTLENVPELAKLCRKPVYSELICDAWDNGKLIGVYAQHDDKRSSSTHLLQDFMLFFEKRYLVAIGENEQHAGELVRYQLAEATLHETRFTEHVAFALSAAPESEPAKVIERCRQYFLSHHPALKFRIDIVAAAIKFGMIIPVDTREKDAADYRFIDPTLNEFMAARYIASCLQSQLDTDKQSRSNRSSYPPFQKPDNGQPGINNISDYVQVNSQFAEFKEVGRYVAGLLEIQGGSNAVCAFLRLLLDTLQHDIAPNKKANVVLVLSACLNEAHVCLSKILRHSRQYIGQGKLALFSEIQQLVDSNELIIPTNTSGARLDKLLALYRSKFAETEKQTSRTPTLFSPPAQQPDGTAVSDVDFFCTFPV